MFEDPFSYLAEFTGAQALAANGSRSIAVDIDREADFAIKRLAALYTSPNVRVALTDQDDRLILGSGAGIAGGMTPAVNIFGTGQTPYSLPAARQIRRTNQVRVTLTDVSGAPNTVRVLLTGSQLFPAPPYQIPRFAEAEPFFLVIGFGLEATDDAGQVPANGTLEFSRRVPGDSWFELHSIAVSRTAAATLMLMTNGEREWFRRAVHVDLLGASDFVGNYQGIGTPTLPAAAWPFHFDPPKLIPANAVITARVADLSGALNNVRIAFHGIRRYL